MAFSESFIQAQPFSLSVAVDTTATTFVLDSFTLPDGTNITTSMIGDALPMTIEPGTNFEEVIKVTAVTQNANGTANLTVTRGIPFEAPFTADASLGQPHGVGATLIITNAAVFYQNIIDYIDGLALSDVSGASTSQAGIAEQATTSEVNAGTASGSEGPLFIDPGTLASSDYGQNLPTEKQKTFLESSTGVVKLFSDSNIPSGFLLCDGSAVSRQTYSGLFSVIGTDYGNGDGSTTFNVPDFSGQSSPSGTSYVIVI